MTEKFETGQTVNFKLDHEGHGVVLEAIRKVNDFTDEVYYEYVIGNPTGDFSPWHIEARRDTPEAMEYNCSVVYVDSDHVW